MKRTKHIWRSMWNRCGGLKGDVKGAAKYKGIITVCDRWRSFENFISDMGLAPEGYSLDRIEKLIDSKDEYNEIYLVGDVFSIIDVETCEDLKELCFELWSIEEEDYSIEEILKY